jgi:F-type H+-transporting ATPase subunit b
MENLNLQPGLLIWTLITFGFLMFLLARFTFRPLRRLMEEREKTIRDSLDRAAGARDEAQNILARNEAQLEQAREETRRIIEEGRKLVENMKREAEARARQQADQVVSQAQTDIEREVRRSVDELKNTVVNLSVRVAREVIKENLDEKRHEQIAQDFIDRLKQTHATQRQ